MDNKIKKIIGEIGMTFDSCDCGFYGYTVLPDCEENPHYKDCARCYLNELREIMGMKKVT